MKRMRHARRMRRSVQFLQAGFYVLAGIGYLTGSQVLAAPPQAGSAAAATETYRVKEGSVSLGTARVTVRRTPTGYILPGATRLKLPQGRLLLDSVLVTKWKGKPQSYRLQGKIAGNGFQVTVQFLPGKIVETIQQGEWKRIISIPHRAPVYVIDNNLLNGWQALLYGLHYQAGKQQDFDVFIPQIAKLAHVEVKVQRLLRLQKDGYYIGVWPLRISLKFGPQVIPMMLWVERGTRRLLALRQGEVNFVAEGIKFPVSFQMKLPALSKALAARFTRQGRCLLAEPVKIRVAGATLVGTLTIPRNRGPHPAVLLVPGSDPTNQNGNSPLGLNDFIYKQLAYDLGCRGYAVLRYNKRGLPPSTSTGSGNHVTLAIYAGDVAAWMERLGATPGIDPARLVISGHSAGGLIALYAVVKDGLHPEALVLLESAGEPLPRVIESQLVYQARLRGEKPKSIARIRHEVHELVRAIEHSHGWSLHLHGRLTSNRLARLFAPAAGLLRSEFAVVPARLIKKIHLPTLIVQGGKDAQVLPANGGVLKRANPRATLLFLPDLTVGCNLSGLRWMDPESSPCAICHAFAPWGFCRWR